MNYRHLGNSGLLVSEIGFGSWLTLDGGDLDRATELHRVAYEAGINFFDTANAYGSGGTEPVVGHALRPFPRETYVLATKVFWPYEPDWPFPTANDRGLSRKHLHQEMDKSLRRLGVEYLDLYQCHRYDEHTPLEETCRAMSDLVERGKTLYWGVSEWTGPQIEAAVEICAAAGWHRPISNQPIYNMLDRHWEEGVFPTTARCGLGNVCFSPLAEGMLTGKYLDATPDDTRAGDEKQGVFLRRRFTEENIERVRGLATVAAELDVPMSTLALRWCLRRAEISSCIVGATRSSQLLENIAAVDFEWDDSIESRIAAILA